ncbi:helix-turn-helix domain-containing protein [Deinococcus cellulosilyticus]|uniref:HTH araC/xylS-type domain-containing protein n=1 Tax=Deinococcus cellulosilyticus (strain DSM 18568 / NBRC 106333 / KACC 11606 / 5516J-15) TaxID=1223518 RepID=A0A511MXU3_DEIC1|nr:AraC family transcriptional regulator [Deinococcus cellulosilyticus]GEM45412.1 hypothetical protein DC3_10470 [Deinococcus cellulosilyticus NBRC 106333 = KACC 11606]
MTPGWILHACQRSEDYEAFSEEGGLSIKTMHGFGTQYQVGRQLLGLNQGRYLVLNAGQPYTVQVPRGVESFCMFFSAEFTRDVYSSLSLSTDALLEGERMASPPEFLPRTFEQPDPIAHAMERLRGWSATGELTPERRRNGMESLLLELLYAHQMVQGEVFSYPATRHSTRQDIYRRVHRARDFLEAHLHQPITLEDLAGVANLTVFHFCRAFKHIFHCTPNAYLTHRRLERAKWLLKHTSLSVLEVTLDVGFESPTTFSTVFKKRFGMTPTQYRSQSG